MFWLHTIRRSGIALPAAAFALGLGLSVAGGVWLHFDTLAQADAEFRRNVFQLTDDISDRFETPLHAMRGAAGMYKARGQWQRAEFRAYVESRDLAQEFPGVRGLGFVERVARGRLAEFTAIERADSAPQFAVRALKDMSHSDLYVIKYIEPPNRNRGAAGLDLGSEKVRRAGVERAIATGAPTLTGIITLVQDEDRSPGFLLFLPMYRNGTDAVTPAQRSAALVGLVFAPVVAAELLGGIGGVENGLLNFSLLDPEGGTPESQSAYDSSAQMITELGLTKALPYRSRFEEVRTLSLAGRDFRLHIRSGQRFDAAVPTTAPWVVFGGSATLSLLIAALLRQQASGRQRAERLAATMTHDLERLAQVVRRTSNAVSIADRDARITWVNEGFTRITGYTTAEARGKTPGELLGTDNAEPSARKKITDSMAAGQGCRIEILNRAKDGREYWIDTEVQPLLDARGECTGFMEIGNDVSARKHAEAEVERSALLLRGAIDAIGEAFVLYDADDRLVFCNERYRKLYALSADKITLGTPFEAIVRAGAERGQMFQVEDVEAWVAERVAAHRAADATSVQRLGDGRVLRVIDRKMPDGHTVGFRIDITELVRASEAAQAASTAKSQFLANMSHELRTPMNAVLGMLALLRKTALDTRQADYAAKTEGAARSLLGLLNEILDFSKVEAGKMTLDLQPFRTDHLVRDLAVIVSATLGTKPVALHFDIDPAVPRHLVGDAMRLQQVLINLSGNAIKFTAQGEVVVSVKVLARHTGSDPDSDSDPDTGNVDDSGADRVTLQFSVRDTGIGIAPQNQARIFSGFTQAEASTTRRFGGTGLGVAISQRLVALMGGELQLDSALGQGSRFYFQISLPLADASCELDPPSAPVPLGASSQRLAGLRLLVAEDNPNNQQVARELLEDEGAVVLIAADGQQAVHALAGAAVPFDAVLMDLQMPVLDGLAATRLIRQNPQHRQLPIVAMTANAMASDREACLAAGMNDHVGKPFELDHLVRVLRRHTGRVEAPASIATTSPRILTDAVLAAAATAGVDLQAALDRLGGKHEVYLRMLRSFVRELAGTPELLRDHRANADSPTLVRLLHTLKGLAATLGAAALSAEAARCEKTAPTDAEGAVQQATAAVLAHGPGLARLLTTLRLASAAASAPTTAIDARALQTSLVEMATQLRSADMAATETMERLQRHFASDANLAETLQPLERAMAVLDFKLALQLCEVLIESLTEAPLP